ncbi:hypothetical protein O181_037750 [Austropuccinia psidii MF-1]|uniref:Uncharacterized protein n=1 Tax=Austropuccinia psidii MF-1 TaxID=1389203 RepID=A0A9Q3DBK8_9BASI|nr:hypothetical protein [Austropuccinia psidii MF-1]
MPPQSEKFFSSHNSDTSDTSNSDSEIGDFIPNPSNIQYVSNPLSLMETQLPPVQEQAGSSNLDTTSPAFSAFSKTPSKFVSNVPKIDSDGSNFADWSKGLDNIIFNEVLFTNDPNNFESIPIAKGALCFFIQQTIFSDILEMIQNEASPKQAFM